MTAMIAIVSPISGKRAPTRRHKLGSRRSLGGSHLRTVHRPPANRGPTLRNRARSVAGMPLRPSHEILTSEPRKRQLPIPSRNDYGTWSGPSARSISRAAVTTLFGMPRMARAPAMQQPRILANPTGAVANCAALSDAVSSGSATLNRCSTAASSLVMRLCAPSPRTTSHKRLMLFLASCAFPAIL